MPNDRPKGNLPVTQPQPASSTRSGSFTWTTVAAIVMSCGLAVYFLIGYRIARQLQPASPATVIRAAHFSGSWPMARLAWMFAVLLGLALLVWALARSSKPPRHRRALVAALSLSALVAVVAALLVSPARPVSPQHLHFGMLIDDTGGYARAGLLFVVTALLYSSAALASRRG